MRTPLLLFLACFLAHGQSASLRPTGYFAFPTPMVDGNSPGFWQGERFTVFTSTGYPIAMTGTSLFDLAEDTSPLVMPYEHYPIWIESVWVDEDGTLYGWYHHEPKGVCGSKGLTAPVIGAAVSTDGGQTFQDLGIVLSSGESPNCNAKNGFFAGGHGDFSVIPDRDGKYFYFLFDNYGGPAETQGVVTARLAMEDRANPVGAVYKYHNGDWAEPGIGGQVTPIFPVAVPWGESNTNAYWGPAVHWNTFLNQYVAVLNHACCKTNWPQEGIYITFNPDLSDPAGWTSPYKILDSKDIGFAPGYYPQVFGTGPGESDTLAGESARLFVKGVSKWEIVFAPPEPRDTADPVSDSGQHHQPAIQTHQLRKGGQ